MGEDFKDEEDPGEEPEDDDSENGE
jgi:hypothetical protein